MEVNICSCGHAVSRHELLGTEYARCSRLWSCYCSGIGSGVEALAVEETVEKPSGSQTNSKYFRRKCEPSREKNISDHPLNVGLKRCDELGIGYRWLTGCTLCGEWTELTAYPVVDGAVKIVLYGLVQESALLCEPCGDSLREMSAGWQ